MKNLLLVSLITPLLFVTGAHATLIASIGNGATPNEFSGVQGQDGWSYGYWDVPAGTTMTDYVPADFTAFLGGSDVAGNWSDTHHWNDGSGRWDYNPVGGGVGNPPWTEIGNGSMHPQDANPGNPDNGGLEMAAVLRYEVEPGFGSNLYISGFFNNVSANADGTTGRIFHNGTQLYSVLTDGTTDNFSNVNVTAVAGDYIDFMIDIGPTAGTPGSNGDGSDGTNYRFQINAIPEPSSLMLCLLGVAGLVGFRRRG